MLLVAYLAFVSLGLPDTLIGVAWPSIRTHFALSQSAVSLVFLGAGTGYILSSALTGRLLRAVGVGPLLAASTSLVALAVLGYAWAPSWPLFAACAVLHGLGSGAIDAALNHHAAHTFSARHMTWLHASYSLGATLGPVWMTAAISYRTWRSGYVSVAAVIAVLAMLFAITRQRWSTAAPSPQPTPAPHGRSRLVYLQVAIFFVYTGLELTVGQWAFTVLVEARRAPTELAGTLVAAYWASILLGRVLFGVAVAHVEIDRLLRACTLTALAGVAAFTLSSGTAGIATGLALTGLALAPIYPCLMARTPERLGPDVSLHAIGWQVAAATLGAATMPSLAGLAAQHFGVDAVPVLALALAAALLTLHEALLR